MFMICSGLDAFIVAPIFERCKLFIVSRIIGHMEPAKKSRGRPPAAPEQKLEHMSIRVTAEQRAKIEAAGMVKLRALISRWHPK
jgi:hypothetical protein